MHLIIIAIIIIYGEWNRTRVSILCSLFAVSLQRKNSLRLLYVCLSIQICIHIHEIASTC